MKKYSFLFAILLFAGTFVACGTSSTNSTDTQNSSSALSIKGNVQDHSVKAIQERGKLIVTTEATYAPFEFQDEKGNIVGLDASIAQALADDLGVKLEMQNIDFNSVVPEVQAGNADLAIAGLSPTPERKANLLMSDIYYKGTQSLLVLKEDAEKYTTAESLKGKTIATQKASIQDQLIQDLFPDSKALLLPKFPQAIAELKNGNCAAVLLDNVSAEQFIKNTPGLEIAKIEVKTDPATDGNAIGAMNGNDDLIQFVNQKIDEYQKSGKIDMWFQQAQEKAAQMGIS